MEEISGHANGPDRGSSRARTQAARRSSPIPWLCGEKAEARTACWRRRPSIRRCPRRREAAAPRPAKARGAGLLRSSPATAVRPDTASLRDHRRNPAPFQVLNVRATPEAGAQIRAITDWWVTNRPSAKSMFAEELDAAFDTISTFPNAGGLYHPRLGIRRLLLRATRPSTSSNPDFAPHRTAGGASMQRMS